jgi:hypothetical protein
MFKKFVNKYFFVLIIIILGSGFLIFGFNLIRGENLAKAPNFDLSRYEEIKWPELDELFSENNPIDIEKVDQLVEKVSETLDKKKGDTEELLPKKIYFNNSFSQDSSAKTLEMINNFIKDFPSLVELKFVDLAEFSCAVVELPATQRESLKKDLLENELVLSLEVDQAPAFNLCFKEKIYFSQYEEFLLQYPVLVSKFKALDNEYIGYLDYGELDVELITNDLDKLRKEYSDVIKIVD